MSGIVIDGVGASDSNHCSASPRLPPTSTNECEGRVPATSPFCLSTHLSQPTYVYQSEMPATSGHGTVMGTYVDASVSSDQRTYNMFKFVNMQCFLHLFHLKGNNFRAWYFVNISDGLCFRFMFCYIDVERNREESLHVFRFMLFTPLSFEREQAPDGRK